MNVFWDLSKVKCEVVCLVIGSRIKVADTVSQIVEKK